MQYNLNQGVPERKIPQSLTKDIFFIIGYNKIKMT